VLWSLIEKKEVQRIKVEEDEQIVNLMISPEDQIVASCLSQIFICQFAPPLV
jgi:hypothetical protein